MQETDELGAIDGLVSTQLVARRLGVSRQAIRGMVLSGRLPAVKSPVGYLYDPFEVERLRQKWEVVRDDT